MASAGSRIHGAATRIQGAWGLGAMMATVSGAAAAGERAMSPIPVGSQITTETGQISPDYLQIKVPY